MWTRGCFFYILDSSNSCSITFWTTQFGFSCKSNWNGILTVNSNGSWISFLQFWLFIQILYNLLFSLLIFWNTPLQTMFNSVSPAIWNNHWIRPLISFNWKNADKDFFWDICIFVTISLALKLVEEPALIPTDYTQCCLSSFSVTKIF